MFSIINSKVETWWWEAQRFQWSFLFTESIWVTLELVLTYTRDIYPPQSQVRFAAALWGAENGNSSCRKFSYSALGGAWGYLADISAQSYCLLGFLLFLLGLLSWQHREPKFYPLLDTRKTQGMDKCLPSLRWRSGNPGHGWTWIHL